MSPRKIRDAADADHQLAAARAAGLPNRNWAVQNGICARSLHMWSVHRRRARLDGALPRFVELVAAVAPPAPTEPLRLLVGDVQIDVTPGFDTDTLARLLAVVRAC